MHYPYLKYCITRVPERVGGVMTGVLPTGSWERVPPAHMVPVPVLKGGAKSKLPPLAAFTDGQDR